MSILGVSAFHHDSAAALIKKGRIIGACHEERFTRKKFDSNWPQQSIDYLHNKANGIKTVSFYDKDNKGDSKSLIKKQFPQAEVVYVDHHESHAMSSILTTDWEECAVMVVDTVGGDYSTSLGVFSNNQFKWLKRIKYPNSLGLFYSTATRLLGFKPLHQEAQVMAAAGYGTPKWADYIKNYIIQINEGNYQLKLDLRRGVGYGVLDWDIACSVQSVLEEALLSLAKWLQKETGMNNLAYSGGVALNCVANTTLSKFSGFENIAIQPASGDAGCSLGAAALISRPSWDNAYLGYSDNFNNDAQLIAKSLLAGKIVPVITGKAEFGPRALGNRSFLALPTIDNSERLHILKGRKTDTWRPWAPVCLEEFANSYFTVYNENYNYEMLFVADTLTNKWFNNRMKNARLQIVNKRKNLLLSEILEITSEQNQPILINTSLNARGKPIVNSIDDYKRELL